MNRPRALAMLALAALLAGAGAVDAAPRSVETYEQYQPLFRDSSGTFHDRAGGYAGQWDWTAGADGYRGVQWEPGYREWFRLSPDGNWIMLDGWRDNGTYYTQRVDSESYGAPDCTGMKAIPSDAGQQHYARRGVGAYCLIAAGTITERSSGKVFRFRHIQRWSAPFACANAYHVGQRCVSQHEQWYDDNDRPWGLHLDRLNYFAKGKGFFWSRNGEWRAHGRTYR